MRGSAAAIAMAGSLLCFGRRVSRADMPNGGMMNVCTPACLKAAALVQRDTGANGLSLRVGRHTSVALLGGHACPHGRVDVPVQTQTFQRHLLVQRHALQRLAVHGPRGYTTRVWGGGREQYLFSGVISVGTQFSSVVSRCSAASCMRHRRANEIRQQAARERPP
jgi:hypothetical protein